MKQYTTIKEASRHLGVSEQRVRTLVREGRILGFRLGKVWVLPNNYDAVAKPADKRERTMNTDDRITKKRISASKLNALSFFSGAMGLDIGLEKAGINVLLACELDKASRKTIEANASKIGLIGDILDYSVEQILEHACTTAEQIDVICGGPPCQAFSTAGKRQGFQDERGNVFLKFIDVIKQIKPRYAVIENVRGLLSSKLNIEVEDTYLERYGHQVGEIPGSALHYIVTQLEEVGYDVSFNLYNAANFGVPQKRERVVIIASFNGRVPYLQPTHSEDGAHGLFPWRTLNDCLEDINETNEYVRFSDNRLKYFRLLKPGQYWKDLPSGLQEEAMGKSFHLGGGKTGFFRRLAWDRPSPTLVTHPAMPATELAHPSEDRPLSISEYKRVQQFPDEWDIQGTILDKYRQIGNAVPVGLGFAIGKALINHAEGKSNRPETNSFRYSRYIKTSDVEWRKQFEKQLAINQDSTNQLKLW
jgi:DNA (cytosine-5)-methyltransferase 1